METSGVKPPGHMRLATDTMDFAPETLDELPAWLASLKGGQVERCWVALVIELAFDVDGQFQSSRRALAAALAAVRDWKRRTEPESVSSVRDPGSTPSALRWRNTLRAMLPNVGDERALPDLFPIPSHRTMVGSHYVSHWPEFAAEIKPRYGEKGPNTRFVRRIAV